MTNWLRSTSFQLLPALSILAACLLPLTGCSHSDRNAEGIPKEKVEQGSRLSQIAHRVDGDWEKLTEEEKAFVTKDLAYGNEANAKMLLLGAAGKLGGGKMGGRPGVPGQRPGGPPVGGAGTPGSR
jgi:hypothetical protein